jgi:hypothetical protein
VVRKSFWAHGHAPLHDWAFDLILGTARRAPTSQMRFSLWSRFFPVRPVVSFFYSSSFFAPFAPLWFKKISGYISRTFLRS